MTTEHPSMAGRAVDPWGDRDWSTYYAAVGGKPARDTLLTALAAAGPGEGRSAIDVGAGEGRDTRELLARGFRVLALDPHPAAQELLARGLTTEQAGRLVVVRAGAEDLASVLAEHPEFAAPVIVNASFSLPFVRPERFASAWRGIRGALAGGGGIFSGQLFGHLDTWASNPTRTHHRPEQVDELLRGLSTIQLTVDEKDGHDAEGTPKHWHVYHVVARAERE